MTGEEHFDQDPGPDAWAGDTLGAAEAMSDDELDAAIDALAARERRCLIGGNVEHASPSRTTSGMHHRPGEQKQAGTW
ncbi:hypothetical protein GS528_27740 [Rhodococcus hoagii]|nr:hypothetical protein [Prescottella equi]